jgi:hypothetical protein
MFYGTEDKQNSDFILHQQMPSANLLPWTTWTTSCGGLPDIAGEVRGRVQERRPFVLVYGAAEKSVSDPCVHWRDYPLD